MLAFGPKKDGSPNVKFFESAETLAALEVVRQWLHKTVKKVSRYLPISFNRCLFVSTNYSSWLLLDNKFIHYFTLKHSISLLL